MLKLLFRCLKVTARVTGSLSSQLTLVSVETVEGFEYSFTEVQQNCMEKVRGCAEIFLLPVIPLFMQAM